MSIYVHHRPSMSMIVLFFPVAPQHHRTTPGLQRLTWDAFMPLISTSSAKLLSVPKVCDGIDQPQKNHCWIRIHHQVLSTSWAAYKGHTQLHQEFATLERHVWCWKTCLGEDVKIVENDWGCTISLYLRCSERCNVLVLHGITVLLKTFWKVLKYSWLRILCCWAPTT